MLYPLIFVDPAMKHMFRRTFMHGIFGFRVAMSPVLNKQCEGCLPLEVLSRCFPLN